MTIRAARSEDAPALAQIAVEAYSGYVETIGREPAPMRPDFPGVIASGHVWVCEQDRVEGFVIAYASDGAWHLENVAVSPSAAGRGIGRRLIGHVETLAKADGAPHVDLYTNARMTANLGLYPALGYEEIDRRVDQGFDRVFFRKVL